MRSIFTCILLFAALPLFSPQLNALELVRDGRPVAKIYVAPGEKQKSLAVAIEDFKSHIHQMSGATLEVVEAASL